MAEISIGSRVFVYRQENDIPSPSVGLYEAYSWDSHFHGRVEDIVVPVHADTGSALYYKVRLDSGEEIYVSPAEIELILDGSGWDVNLWVFLAILGFTLGFALIAGYLQ